MTRIIQYIKYKPDIVTTGITLLLGFFVIVGWFTQSTALVQILPEYSPMQFNTALCFILLSVIILFQNYRHYSSLLYFVITIIIGISLLTFWQHLSDKNTGIDTFFITPFTTANTLHPGRMSMLTTSGFLLSTLPLFILVQNKKNRIVIAIGIFISVLVIALGLGNIAGYLFGQSTPYAWSHSGYMAVHTSLAFILSGISLYFDLTKKALELPKYNYIFFTLLPVSLLLFSTITILWFITYTTQIILVNNIVKNETKMFSSELSDILEADQTAFKRMVKRWNRNSIAQNNKSWVDDASDYVNSIISLRTLIIIENGGTIKHIIPNKYTDSWNKKITEAVKKIEGNYQNEVKKHSFVNEYEDSILLLSYRINFNNNKHGFLVAVYDIKELFKYRLKQDNFDYGLVFYDDENHIVFKSFSNTNGLDTTNKIQTPIELFSNTWNLEYYPSFNITSNSNHWFVLIIGLIFSGILLQLLYQRYQNKLRSISLVNVNTQLNLEVEQRKQIENELTEHKINLEATILQRTVEVYDANQGLTEEIEKRKISENKLIDANSRFEQFANNTTHVIWLVDVETKQVNYVNPAFEKIWQEKAQQLYIEPLLWQKKIHPDDVNNVRLSFAAALKGDTDQYDIEYRITKLNGEIVWIHDHGVPIFNESGVMTKYTKIAEDITLRKSAEQALQNSEENYRQIVETTNEGIVVIDPITNIQFINTRITELLGFSNETLMNSPIQDYIDHTNYLEIKHLLKMPSNEPRRTEATFIDKFKNELKTKICITSIFSGINNNVYKGSLILVTDITHEILAAKEHHALQQQLQQSQKMESIGQLTGGIAHDFNNILSSVLGFTELSLEQNNNNDELLSDYLSEVLIAGERAQELVQQMLTFSRGTAGELKPLSLSPLIKETIKLLRPTIPASLIINVTLDSNIPKIKADGVQIHQLLMNLCINARDAMCGIGNLTITLNKQTFENSYCTSCFEPINGEYAVLAIEDTGEGIDPEKKSTIFEPFYTTKEVGKGSGMGLSMVHGITHDHHGHILVHSELTVGTKFEILFPLNIIEIRKTGND